MHLNICKKCVRERLGCYIAFTESVVDSYFKKVNIEEVMDEYFERGFILCPCAHEEYISQGLLDESITIYTWQGIRFLVMVTQPPVCCEYVLEQTIS